MKICHVITRFIVGGAQENTLLSVAGLAARGHDVTLVSGPSTGSEGCLLEVLERPVDRLPFRFIEEPDLVRPLHPWHDLRAWLRLRGHFARARYDIIHTHSSKAGIVGRKAASHVRTRGISAVVHTIHGLAFDALQPAWRNLLYRTAERSCAHATDALVSVCDAMTHHALRNSVGSPEKYTTIYSGMELSAFQDAARRRADLRARHGFSCDDVVLMSVARLSPMKGVDQFLYAVADAQQRSGRCVRAVLLGDGPLRDELRRWAQVHLQPGSVHFAGVVAPGEIPEWIAAADVVVHASLREGLARTLVQALAAGVPVVTYNVGGAREVVQDGVNGVLVPCGRTAGLCTRTLELVRDAGVRRRLTHGARATKLDQFDADAMVGALEELYERLSGERSSIDGG